jgi:hypothetical protein
VTILETVAVFVGAPLAIYVIVVLLTLVPSKAKRRPHYKPGQTWEIAPQWWAGDVPVVAAEAIGSDNVKGGARGTW